MAGLYVAAWHGDEAEVQNLLELGEELNYQDPINSRTPLAAAAGNGHTGVVNILLECGAEVEAPDEMGYTPLMVALENGHDAAAIALLEGGANVNVVGMDGSTVLHCAGRSGSAEAAAAMIAAGASLNVSDMAGDTPLHEATVAGHLEVVRLYVESGANTEATNDAERTPLQVSTRSLDGNHFCAERHRRCKAVDKYLRSLPPMEPDAAISITPALSLVEANLASRLLAEETGGGGGRRGRVDSMLSEVVPEDLFEPQERANTPRHLP